MHAYYRQDTHRLLLVREGSAELVEREFPALSILSFATFTDKEMLRALKRVARRAKPVAADSSGPIAHFGNNEWKVSPPFLEFRSQVFE